MPSERAVLADNALTTDEPAPRPARSRPPSRWSAGSIVPVLLAVLAAAFAYEALQDRSSMTGIVVARSSVPAGAVINGSDARAIKVHASDTALVHGLLKPSELREGWVTTVAVRAGQPVTLSEVEKPSLVPALGEMSIALPVQQAAGGSIGAGDLVDVIAANGSGGAYYVAQGLRVVSVAPAASNGGALGGTTGNYFVVVAVDKKTALHIAAALGAQGGGAADANIEIVRSDGEAPTAKVAFRMAQPPGAGPVEP